jgi:hypothetical protein
MGSMCAEDSIQSLQQGQITELCIHNLLISICQHLLREQLKIYQQTKGEIIMKTEYLSETYLAQRTIIKFAI